MIRMVTTRQIHALQRGRQFTTAFYPYPPPPDSPMEEDSEVEPPPPPPYRPYPAILPPPVVLPPPVEPPPVPEPLAQEPPAQEPPAQELPAGAPGLPAVTRRARRRQRRRATRRLERENGIAVGNTANARSRNRHGGIYIHCHNSTIINSNITIN